MPEQRYTFTLPGGSTLTLRELTVRDLDEVSDAAYASGKGIVEAGNMERRMLLQRSLVALDGVKTSGEEIYHRLSAKGLQCAEAGYSKIHNVDTEALDSFFDSMTLEGESLPKG